MGRIKRRSSEDILLDPEDQHVLREYPWSVQTGGRTHYVRLKICNKSVKLHRFLLNPDPDQCIDHKNGNGLDNRRSNLRVCNRYENMRNCKRHTDNTSGYKGVTWDKDRRLWRAQIRSNNRVMYLGLFANPEDAAVVYNKAAIQYHGEFARINTCVTIGTE